MFFHKAERVLDFHGNRMVLGRTGCLFVAKVKKNMASIEWHIFIHLYVMPHNLFLLPLWRGADHNYLLLRVTIECVANIRG